MLLNHRADRVVHWHDVEAVGAQQDDIRLLAGRRRADLAIETIRARTLDGGEFQHVADGKEGRRILVSGMPAFPHLALLQRKYCTHLTEEIIRHRSSTSTERLGRMPVSIAF